MRCRRGGAFFFVGVVFLLAAGVIAAEKKEFMTADELISFQKDVAEKPTIQKGDHKAGREIYVMYCTTCHGMKGDGKGPLARMLDPKPRNHTDGEYMNCRSDEQLFAAIEKGGKGVKRSVLMPAFGFFLSQDDIWNLVSYMRTISVGKCVPTKK